MKCCKHIKSPCVSIPLACIVEYKGVLALVKSSFPKGAKIISRDKLAENNPFASTIVALLK